MSSDGKVADIPIIDCDVHTFLFVKDSRLTDYLPSRWADYITQFGMRGMTLCGERPRQKAFAARGDAVSPRGGPPGTDPEFVREQLLDEYNLSGAIMNDIFGFVLSGGRPYPDEYAVAMSRALNCCRAERWFTSDPRWFGSITLPYEVPSAEKEIQRCKDGPFGDRWVQVLMAPDNEKPAGNPRYWPIYELCEHYGIPVAFHFLANRRITGTGTPNYYFEEHTAYVVYNYPLVASLIFEGVFERFPKLKVALLELAWSWVPPFVWRLDRAYDLLGAEVPHLTRLPSEYVAEHFWFSTQPMEEPEHREWFDGIYQMFEDTVGHRLMYSSDYPHWDFDMPENLPATLPFETRRRIFGRTASELYGIPLGDAWRRGELAGSVG